MIGNVSLPSDSKDPKNGWEGYRMAAVYSSRFTTGPGVRLYFHAAALNGTSYVKEFIWIQDKDTWSDGATFHDVNPNSHIAATVDESNDILRLFYSTSDGTLQEAWMDLTDPSGRYKPGILPLSPRIPQSS